MSVLAEKLNQIMAELRRIPDVPSILIIRKDGTVIASNMPLRTDPNRVASMVAAIVGTSKLAVCEMEQGGFQEVMVDTEEGRVLGVEAGENSILVAMAKKEANIGLVLLTLKRHAAQVAEILGSGDPAEESLALTGAHRNE